MRIRLLLPVLASLALAGALPAAAGAAPPPPVVVTGAASTIGPTGASIAGTVTPGGADTTFQIEYGTTTAYGLKTTAQDIGAGTDPVPVSASLSALTSGTTYHYRVIATNAAGVGRGEDATFTTTSAPVVTTLAADGLKVTGANLRGTVRPGGLATTYHFEYGPTTSYGSVTPDATASGYARAPVSAALTGLSAFTTYHYRLVASNAQGTVRSGDRTLRTLRAPGAVSLSAAPATTLWNGNVVLSGRVTGAGVGNIPLRVERSDFPFSTARVVRDFKAAQDGSFRTTIGPLFIATRWRVLVAATPSIISPAVTVGNRLFVNLRQRLARRSTRLGGSIVPAVPDGTVTVRKRTSTGRWLKIATTRPTSGPGNTSRYAITVRRGRKPARLRVTVAPNDGGAHASGASRAVLVPRRG